MTQTIIREAVKESPVKSGENLWRVIVAKPGKGSSGTYSAEVFKRDAHKMVPAGAQSFFTHDDKRDPRDMLGYFPKGAEWSEEDQAVVAELSVFESWKPLVEQLAPHVGISLYALGEQDADGNITAFIEDAYNGADLVSRPGLSGAGFDKKLYEEARSSLNKPVVENASAQDSLTGKDNKMDEKILEALEALTASVNSLKSAKETEATEAAQVEADEKVAEERVEAYAGAIEAIESARAELLPSQVKSLLAEAKKGGDVTAAIESAKALVAEMREDEGRVQESSGRVVGATKYESASELGKVFG